MFRKTKEFVQNHWRKVLFGGIAIQAAGYGLRYATNRFVAYQEDQALSYWKKIKKQQHYESVEENCLTTYRLLFQIMKQTIRQTLDAEEVLDQLKNNRDCNKTKAWEELKVIAFSRVLTTIYGSSILYVFLRLQMSMIGGYISQDSNRREWNGGSTDSTINGPMMDGETQQKFLSLSNHLVTRGVEKICAYIKSKVEVVVGSIPLKQNLSVSDLEQLLWTIIRKDVTLPGASQDSTNSALGNPSKVSWRYIFPEDLLNDKDFFKNPQISELGAQDMYRKFVCEIYDLLESDDVRGVLGNFESHGVSHYVDRISDSIDSPSSFEDEHATFSEPRILLAKLIPIMNKFQFVDMLDDPWVNLLMNSEAVRTLGANVYEAFSADVM